MKTTQTITLALTLALGASLGACNSEQAPADGAETATADAGFADTIKARQAALKKISDANKAIKAALEDSAPDLPAVAASATEINDEATKLAALFPQGSGKESGEKTEALATIWEKPEDFTTALNKLIDGSAALATAANSGDVAATLAAAKDVGGSCKNCHMTFREKKQ